MNDLISRRAAIDALWKALYEYEDKMEKQFQESDELDVSNWILDRMFVQNMSDIDRQTILNLPSAQLDIIRCKDCKHHWTHKCMDSMPIEICDLEQIFYDAEHDFCSLAERREDG